MLKLNEAAEEVKESQLGPLAVFCSNASVLMATVIYPLSA